MPRRTMEHSPCVRVSGSGASREFGDRGTDAPAIDRPPFSRLAALLRQTPGVVGSGRGDAQRDCDRAVIDELHLHVGGEADRVCTCGWAARARATKCS